MYNIYVYIFIVLYYIHKSTCVCVRVCVTSWPTISAAWET